MPVRYFWGDNKQRNTPDEFDVNIDYYKVIGLSKNATQQDIKNQYYKLCYEYHPDRTGGLQQDRFKDINNAYQIIGDVELRKKYDAAK